MKVYGEIMINLRSALRRQKKINRNSYDLIKTNWGKIMNTVNRITPEMLQNV